MTTYDIHPFLDADKQIKAREYEKQKRFIGIISSVVSLLLMLIIYFSGFSYWLANVFHSQSIILSFLVYVSVFLALSTLVGLPLSYYGGYIHEKHWDFSNHTVKSWIWDYTKSFLLGLVITPILLGLLFWIMSVAPDVWWLVAGLAVAIVSVIFATLVPVVILPIFNKYSPIENDDLTGRLKIILEKAGLRPSGFFVEDMSKQTKKENAFLAGLGKTRRVVLADNLLENMSVEEIESVIAHEVGHYKYSHIWKMIATGTVQQLIIFFLLDQVMTYLFPEFLTTTRWNLTLFPIFSVLMGFLSSFLFGPLSNALSRHYERQADRTALEMIEDKQHFLSAMAGLANRNLSNAYPGKWIKMLYYSHPPIGERLAFGESWE